MQLRAVTSFVVCIKILFCFISQDLYGIDWDGPVPMYPEEDVVTVPDTHAPTDQGIQEYVQRYCTLDRVLMSPCHAVDIYCRVIDTHKSMIIMITLLPPYVYCQCECAIVK